MENFPVFTSRQKEALAATRDHKYVLYGGAGGGGKMQPVDAEVWTPWGAKEMGYIVVGDQVCNPEGGVSRVIAVWEHGLKDVYRVTFEDGASCEVGLEHLWQVRRLGARRYRRKPRATSERWRICTTEGLRAALRRGQRLAIPLAQPVQQCVAMRYSKGRWPVPPYTLGVILGDGCTRGSGVTVTTADSEVIDRIRDEGVKIGAVTRKPGNRASSFGLLGLRPALDRLGLLGTLSRHKRVHPAYLAAPLPRRWALLRGLMDTDGFAGADGDVSFCSTSRGLALDVQALARSLGFKALITSKIPTLRGLPCARAYNVWIRGPNRDWLFTLPRKRARAVTPFNGGSGEVARRIVSVRWSRKARCRCITVDHPNGLYLTNDFIVTHNSYFLRWWLVLVLISAFRKFKVRKAEAGLFCEDYPALQNRQIGKIQSEFHDWLGKWNASLRQFVLHEKWGGGILKCLNLDDVGKYRSAEFCAVAVDELTLNPRAVFDALIWRLRWSGMKDEDCRFLGGTNPTGPGHLWVKKFWVDRDFRKEPAALSPDDFAFVPARASDNPHLPEEYFTKTLASLPDAMRKALMDGSWDVVEGQYFLEWNADLHVKPPRTEEEGITDKWGIPFGWQRIGGVDWGRAAPWAALEAAIDPDGRPIIYRGVAEPGWDHEQQAEWGRAGSPQCLYLADPACWSKGSANSKEARAKDMSHAELWAKYGWRNVIPAGRSEGATRDRVAGWQHVAAFLKKMPDRKSGKSENRESGKLKEEMPRAWIEFLDVPGLRGDHGIITTLPKLIRDPDRPEDVETKGDDHACFPAETPVRLPDGRDVPICEVKAGDLVEGPFGLQRVLCAGKTIEGARLLEIRMENGRTVRCTSSHPFPTARGIVQACNLMLSDTLYIHASRDHRIQRGEVSQVSRGQKPGRDAILSPRDLSYSQGSRCPASGDLEVSSRSDPKGASYSPRQRGPLGQSDRESRVFVEQGACPAASSRYSGIYGYGATEGGGVARLQGGKAMACGAREECMEGAGAKGLCLRDVRQAVHEPQAKSGSLLCERLQDPVAGEGRSGQRDADLSRVRQDLHQESLRKSALLLEVLRDAPALAVVSVEPVGRADVWNLQTEMGAFLVNGIWTRNSDALRYLLGGRPVPTMATRKRVAFKRGDWFHKKEAEKAGEVEEDAELPGEGEEMLRELEESDGPVAKNW
jgi:hypothetical protein